MLYVRLNVNTEKKEIKKSFPSISEQNILDSLNLMKYRNTVSPINDQVWSIS